jgi:hypothetical protein
VACKVDCVLVVVVRRRGCFNDLELSALFRATSDHSPRASVGSFHHEMKFRIRAEVLV